MKSFILHLFILVCILINSGCEKSCSIDCKNGGTCNDGKCTCSNGYEGNDCTKKSRDKFIGTYAGYFLVTTGQGNDTTNATIFSSGNDVSKLVCVTSGVSINITLSGSTSFVIASQDNGGVYSGSGTLSVSPISSNAGNTGKTISTLTMEFHENFLGATFAHKFIGTKID